MGLSMQKRAPSARRYLADVLLKTLVMEHDSLYYRAFRHKAVWFLTFLVEK